MTLVIKILTGSPEQWVQVEGSQVQVLKPCDQCGQYRPVENLNQKYCGDRCRWNAANDKRAQD